MTVNDILPSGGIAPEDFPTIHIVSDSVGVTAMSVARAAAAQFGVIEPHMEVIPRVQNLGDLIDVIEAHLLLHHEELGQQKMLVFYTLVQKDLRRGFKAYIQEHPAIVGVDLLTSAVTAIEEVTGVRAASIPGTLRRADSSYFRRVEALEFTIAHDDGRNPQDLTDADIVIIGVSRTSKTPLSIWLAHQGLKVANVPLDPLTEPPAELFEVDPTRIFGLTSSPDTLQAIRQRRFKGSDQVLDNYASLEGVEEDLRSARNLMRQLGCIVIRTDKRAVEETAQEILGYYAKCHPLPTDIIN